MTHTPLTRVSSWLSGGVIREVISTRDHSESLDEFRARHEARFQQQFDAFPEDL